MGLTLVAILTGALLLPGLIAVYFFYRTGRTKEADPVIPSLGSPLGLAQIGSFAVAVHFVYALILWIVSRMPSRIDLPLADPYRVLDPSGAALTTSEDRLALFSGLGFLLVTAAALGHILGELFRIRANRTIFHGPLNAVLDKADGPDAFITAYVLTKIEHAGMVLGYEGTVTALTRDAELLPARVVLKDARPFRIDIAKGGSKREEDGPVMDCIVINSTDWHNIALRVYQIED